MLGTVRTGKGDHLRQANHLDISPSLLPSAGREMSTSQRVVTLCGWGVEAGMAHLRINVWVAGKTERSLLNHLTIHNSLSLSLPAQDLPLSQIFPAS